VGLPPFLSPRGLLGWGQADAELATRTTRVETVAAVLVPTAIGCLGDIGQGASQPCALVFSSLRETILPHTGLPGR